MGPEQLGRLVDEHAAALVLYARQWCAAPEDVVQEAFVKLASQRREPDNLLGWLYRVVRNGALAAARAERRRRRDSMAKSPPQRCKACPSSSAKPSSPISGAA